MNTINEKSSSVMGIVISVLLHGIFFAGCFALDAATSSVSISQEHKATEIHSVADQQPAHRPKS